MEIFSKSLISVGVIGSCCSATVPLITNIGGRSFTEGPKITFEELRTQIDENWRKEQKINSENLNDLPLKEELEKGFLTNNSIDKQAKTGEVMKNEWRECGVTQSSTNKYCGYLEVYSDNIGYKLNIGYELNSKEGQGHLIKNDGGNKKYGNSQNSQGQDITNVEFNKLGSYTSNNASEGNKINELSFKKIKDLKK